MDKDLGKITLSCERPRNERWGEPATTVQMTIDGDVDMPTLFAQFKEFSLAMGYGPSTVKEYFDAESSD